MSISASCAWYGHRQGLASPQAYETNEATGRAILHDARKHRRAVERRRLLEPPEHPDSAHQHSAWAELVPARGGFVERVAVVDL